MPRRYSTRTVFNPGYPAAVLAIAAPKVRRAAEMIADDQRQHIPVSNDGSYGRPAGYARDRIDITFGRDGGGPYLDVGTDAATPDGFPYPAVLDAGSRPHLIESHGPYPLRNRRTGQVFGPVVHHPGTKPTYWCRRSILAIAGKTL